MADSGNRSIRQAQNTLHTWTGLLCGGLLFFVFFMGTLAVFDDEIDSWMRPAVRGDAPAQPVGYNAVIAELMPVIERNHGSLFIKGPGPRRSTYTAVYHAADGSHVYVKVDAASGERLPESGTLGATGFFYPLHFNLMLGAAGRYIVALAGMMMLAMLVSGVITHRRILRDFFSFRREKSRGRSLLDLHNITGVMLLPFLFVICLTGVLIFAYSYMPASVFAAYEQRAAFFEDAFPAPEQPAAGRAAPLAPIGQMLAKARQHWGQGEVLAIGIHHPGDANATVTVYRNSASRVAGAFERMVFDATTGEVIYREHTTPALAIYRATLGLHLAPFTSWLLLWLYFVMGLGGCLLIGTGLLVWLDKRVAQAGSLGYRCAQAAASAGTVGLLIATAAMLCANRLLPIEGWFASAADRAVAEVWVFFGVWIASLAAAAVRPGLANLRMQLFTLAGLCAALPVLNAVTTGDHLLATIARGQWAVASVDLFALAAAAAALYAGLRLAPVASRRRNERRASPLVAAE